MLNYIHKWNINYESTQTFMDWSIIDVFFGYINVAQVRLHTDISGKHINNNIN